MNPDASSLLTMLVLAVLFATGWGNRYVQASRLPAGCWVALWMGTGILGFFDIRWHGVSVHLGSVAVLLAVFGYWRMTKTVGCRLRFVCALVTAAAVCFALMVMFPRDPAFYLLDERYLYPVAAVAAAYLFSRQPLFCLNAAAAGILLAGMVQDNRLAAAGGWIRVGGSDLLDLASTAAILSLFVDQIVALSEHLLARWNRRTADNLEGDPT